MVLVEETEKLLKKLKGSGAKLNEFQVHAIEAIEKTDGNVLVVAPTGSGKTMIGVSALLKHGKGFYLAPLRSLMMEKYIELRKMFPDKKVIITNKDYSVSRKELKEADIRVLSPYKFMLYLDYLEPSDGVVVVDEIHKIHDDPDVEASVTTMKIEGFRIVGLSATIHDSDIPTMSRWLSATVIKHSGERPVPLRFVEVKLDLDYDGFVKVVNGGGYLPNGGYFPTKEVAVSELVSTISRTDPGAGIMVWAATRAEADMYAEMIASRMPKKIFPPPPLTVSTEHDRTLRSTIEKGVAIHHGGISPRNREVVEELFRGKRCNVVVTCFTLSHGVNLPVKYLVITSVYNYDYNPVDPSTFHQIAGRAGRPGLDDVGIVIVVTVGDLESFILSKLLTEQSKRIKSKLHNEWTITKLLAQRLAVDRSVDGVRAFLRETYYVYERGDKGFEEVKLLAERCLTTVVDAYFDINSDGTVEPKGREEEVAARMGLHPAEWGIRHSTVSGNYADSVSATIDLAEKVRGIDYGDAKRVVMDYGLLSYYVGGWKSRELADFVQTVLDALALYARRVYGWRSNEFQNARRVAELFSYGGNPRVEKIVRVLRHDEVKRLIRNMPEIVTETNPDEDTLARYIRGCIDILFSTRKTVTFERVKKVASALVELLYDNPDAQHQSLALDVAKDELAKLAREVGLRVKW